MLWSGRKLRYCLRVLGVLLVMALIWVGVTSYRRWKLNRAFLEAARQGNFNEVERCLKKGVDINVKDYMSRNTALTIALSEGHGQIVTLLLQKGVPVNAPDSCGRTPIFHALHHVELVRLLIEKGADVNHREAISGRVPLHYAAGNNYTQTVKVLVEAGADLDVEDDYGATPMQRALHREYFDMVVLLMSVGAKPTLDVYAALGYLEKVDELLSNGMDPNIVDRYGMSPLHWSSRRGHTQVARALIQAGADVNAKWGTSNDRIRTPLWEAIKHHQVEIARLLIQSGADIHDTIGLSDTYLTLAVDEGDMEIVQLLVQNSCELNAPKTRPPTAQAIIDGHDNIAEYLISKGADTTVTEDITRRTLLHLAAMYNRHEIAEMLVDVGVDINSVDAYGKTPLDSAARSGHREVAEVLIAKGARLNLWSAAALGYVQEVGDLLASGININKKNSEGYAPLHIAVLRKQKDVVSLLISRGANINIIWQGWQDMTPLDLAEPNRYLTSYGHAKRDEGSKEIAALLRAHGAKKARELQHLN